MWIWISTSILSVWIIMRYNFWGWILLMRTVVLEHTLYLNYDMNLTWLNAHTFRIVSVSCFVFTWGVNNCVIGTLLFALCPPKDIPNVDTRLLIFYDEVYISRLYGNLILLCQLHAQCGLSVCKCDGNFVGLQEAVTFNRKRKR